MAVTKISNSGIKTGVLKYDSMLAGNAAYDPAATWLIQRVNGTGSSNTITFSSIPQTYQHLQLRMLVKNTNTSTTGFSSSRISFNGSSASNYWQHYLLGNGTSASAGGNGGLDTAISIIASEVSDTATVGANTYGAVIIDIHDYTSTSKNKTVRIFDGADYNGGGRIALESGLWSATPAAITSITITSGSNNWKSGTTFALYGFIGA